MLHSQPFPPLLSFTCNQVLRAKLKDLRAAIPSVSLCYGVAGPHVEQLGHLKFRFFPDCNPEIFCVTTSDGQNLPTPTQRATVVIVFVNLGLSMSPHWFAILIFVAWQYAVLRKSTVPSFHDWPIKPTVLQRPMAGVAGACRICGTQLVRTDLPKD